MSGEQARALVAFGTVGAGHPEVVQDSLAGFSPVNAIYLCPAGLLDAAICTLEFGNVPPLDCLALNEGGNGVNIPTDDIRAELHRLDERRPRAGERIEDGETIQPGGRAIGFKSGGAVSGHR